MTKQEMVVTILQGLLAGDGSIHPDYARLELVQVAVEYANVVLDETDSRSGLKRIVEDAVKTERRRIEAMLVEGAKACSERRGVHTPKEVSDIIMKYAERVREGKY